MYVPVADFSQFTKAIMDPTKFPEQRPFVDSKASNNIYWNLTCDEVKLNMPNYELSLELIDNNTKNDPSNMFTVTLTKERMLIDGSYFGFESRCYMPIFADWDN